MCIISFRPALADHGCFGVGTDDMVGSERFAQDVFCSFTPDAGAWRADEGRLREEES
jgi:hypothetical protein